MAPRPYWKAYLNLPWVSCPIALFPASSGSERVSFNRINSKTGNRLKQQMVDAESGEPVDKEDIKRGYEYAKGQYVVVEDEEIDKIKIESTHTIEIGSFVPRSEIVDTKAGHFDPKSFEDHYEKALVELLRNKQAGLPVQTIGEETSAPRVINLMDALKASINASTKKPAAASTGIRRPAAKKKTGT